MSLREWFLRLLDQGKSKTEAGMLDYERREKLIQDQQSGRDKTALHSPETKETQRGGR
jgi:hypothetical protein